MNDNTLDIVIPWAEWVDSEPFENVILGKRFQRRECPVCHTRVYEEVDYKGVITTNFYEKHYKEEHVSHE